MVVLPYLIWNSSFSIFIHIFPMPITITIVTVGFVRRIYFTIVFFKVHKNYIFHSFSTIWTLHNFSILLTNSFDKLGIKNIKGNFRAEGFTDFGGELVGIAVDVLKSHDVLIVCEKIFERDSSPLDAGIGAEHTAVKVVGKDDVDSHTVKSPFVFFCIYYNPIWTKSQVKNK